MCAVKSAVAVDADVSDFDPFGASRAPVKTAAAKVNSLTALIAKKVVPKVEGITWVFEKTTAAVEKVTSPRTGYHSKMTCKFQNGKWNLAVANEATIACKVVPAGDGFAGKLVMPSKDTVEKSTITSDDSELDRCENLLFGIPAPTANDVSFTLSTDGRRLTITSQWNTPPKTVTSVFVHR